MLEIKKCEICENTRLESVLELGHHPLCDDLIPFGKEKKCEEYPIEILFCKTCYTAHQRFQVPKLNLFTNNYHYRARMTGSVLTGMSDLVENCLDRFGDLNGQLVLDIGCNDGSLLNFFKNKGCKTFGIDPTDAAKDSKHETLQDFFNPSSAKEILEKIGKPDIITFTNVFAHISNLPELLESLKILINKNTKIVIENHYLGAVLQTDQFDTFYHEHPRTYSHRSFKYIAKSLNLNLIDVQYVSRYGGNIRVYIGNTSPNKIVDKDESVFDKQFKVMSEGMSRWKKETKKWIYQYNKDFGLIKAKAFPGRAAILIKLLDLNESHISAVYEIKGSIKVGHYVPGTRIPILPESDLYKIKKQDDPILNLAWHIPGEVRANLLINGYKGEVLDIKRMNAG